MRKEFEESHISSKRNASFLNIEKRLRIQVAKLNTIANLNLTIGIVTTVAAIVILSFSLLSPSVETLDSSFLIHNVPRMSLSVLIELFSFFFLRMYKSNLNDIKYLNNEITNVDFKLLALDTSMALKREELVENILLEYCKTERNFILKKDESTVEVERFKADQATAHKIIDNLGGLFNKK